MTGKNPSSWFPAVEVKSALALWFRIVLVSVKPREKTNKKSQIKTHLQLCFQTRFLVPLNNYFSFFSKFERAKPTNDWTQRKNENKRWFAVSGGKKNTRDLKWMSGIRVKFFFKLWYMAIEGRLFVIALNTSRARVSFFVPVYVRVCVDFSRVHLFLHQTNICKSEYAYDRQLPSLKTQQKNKRHAEMLTNSNKNKKKSSARTCVQNANREQWWLVGLEWKNSWFFFHLSFQQQQQKAVEITSALLLL